MRKLLYLTTISMSADKLLKNQLKYFRTKSYEVHLGSSFTSRAELKSIEKRENITAHHLNFVREIDVFKDIKALLETSHLLYTLRPDIINFSTPKAGLIGGIASKLTSVPARIYTLRGLRMETATGSKRALLHAMEWIACACAHRVVCVSPSLRERAVQLRLTSPEKAVVLGSGSSNGVDAKRFVPSPELTQQAIKLRKSLSLPSDSPIVGYVGRFVVDKGIEELIIAFKKIYSVDPRTRLLLVGDHEEGDPVSESIRDAINTHPGIVTTGFVSDTAPYYQLMDVLAFPTYREGYPNVPLEANAAGKPVVASDATGAIDAVVHQVTGLIVPTKNAEMLASSLQLLLKDQTLAQQFGLAGQARVLNEFHPQNIWDALDSLYQEVLTEAQRARGQRLKRTIDIAISGIGLAVLGLPMLALSGIVRLTVGAPILFSQRRPGLRGQAFTMYKFRTMRDAVDTQGELLPDHERLTLMGRFLRSSSLDELPELFNVLRGDMSLVGPRPLLMEYLDRYTPQQARRHEVRPGITGWAQVNGRNAISWEEKFDLDVWYVDNRSLALDLKILWMTAQKVAKREGISAAGEATMHKFMGRHSSEA